MNKVFLSGLAILLPIALTVGIVIWIFDLITSPFIGLSRSLLSSYNVPISPAYHWLFVALSRVVAFCLLLGLIFLLGFLGRRFIFAPILKAIQKVLEKIPLINSLYRTFKEIAQSTFHEKKHHLFQGTAIVPFPDQNTHALGLAAAPFQVPSSKEQTIFDQKELQPVFVPTSPHPLSGFLVLYQKEEVHLIDMSTEELFKFLMSCGTFAKRNEKNAEK